MKSMLARLFAPLPVKHLFHRVAHVMDFGADRSLMRALRLLASPKSPFEVDGAQRGDGGSVNIFPVDPLVDHHPEIDFYIGINAFYPPNFDREASASTNSSSTADHGSTSSDAATRLRAAT